MTSLSCGTPNAQVINWSSHLDRQVLTWNRSNAYKRSHIYLSVPPFPSPSFLRLWWIQSLIHWLAEIQLPLLLSFLRLLSGYLHLFSIDLGLCTIFWFGCSKARQYTTDYSTFRTLWCLSVFPFTFSSLHDPSPYDLSLADPGKGYGSFRW